MMHENDRAETIKRPRTRQSIILYKGKQENLEIFSFKDELL